MRAEKEGRRRESRKSQHRRHNSQIKSIWLIFQCSINATLFQLTVNRKYFKIFWNDLLNDYSIDIHISNEREWYWIIHKYWGIYRESSLFLLVVLEADSKNVYFPLSIPNLEIFSFWHIDLFVWNLESYGNIRISSNQQELESFIRRLYLLLKCRHKSVLWNTFRLDLRVLHLDQHLLLVGFSMSLFLTSVDWSSDLDDFALWFNLFLLRNNNSVSCFSGLSSSEVGLMFLSLGMSEIGTLVCVVG